ncbi:hypothetical protein DEM26_18540 [Thioclava sp. NG1]|uniref:hypothetical protein n=1 Tax=Thioclava sp. NG1 TaxID=2182426 RepID=UPI000D60D67F|nr:hypothetical protein [Thioclava sp. NG1]PWE48344.1 hypothetical protein DEM26_18540 [Thioclava sp. NG1]
MSLNATGPCGLTLSALIGQADMFARTMATFGLTRPEQMKSFCSCLGQTLTREYLRLGVAQPLPPYDARLKGIVEPAVDALSEAGHWGTCAELGPYDSPSLEAERVRCAIEMAILGCEAIRHDLDVAASEILDLLAWKQVVLAVPLLVDQRPEEKGEAKWS